MASTIWKGRLAFGLISVPVRLYAAARREGVSFHLIHQACGTRIRMQTTCPTCERVVDRSELVKGYEFEDGQYVLMDAAELEKLTPPSGHTMEVLEFTRMEEVDPVYFDASYYVVAEEAGRRAYQLLARAMEQDRYVGIARLTMHQREHVVVVRPSLGGLMLHTLFYENEVRAVDEFTRPAQAETNPKELDMARLFVKTLATPFDPARFSDKYLENVRRLIEAKAHGQKVTVQEGRSGPPPVADLMTALRASIEQREGQAWTASAVEPEVKPAASELGEQPLAASTPARSSRKPRARRAG